MNLRCVRACASRVVAAPLRGRSCDLTRHGRTGPSSSSGGVCSLHRPCALRASKSDDEERGEDLVKFRERLDRQYLDGKIDDAEKAVSDACADEPASKDCAIAWEELDELRLASNRKSGVDSMDGVDQADSMVSAESLDVFGEADAGTAEGSAQSALQARSRGDPLAEVNPCDVYECDEPGGTLLAAGQLEESLRRPAKAGQAKPARIADLKQDLQNAIGEAIDVCSEEGGEEDACSAAWELVDEITHELDKEEDL